MAYNILTCGGWREAGKTGFQFGPCAGAKLLMVLLFFIFALVRKWGGEELGVEFNIWVAVILGELAHLLIVSITGNIKIAFVVGLVAGLAGGYGSGFIFGGGEY